MHAYLIVSKNSDSFDRETVKLAKLKGSDTLIFNIQKIEDARDLISFLNLTISKKTLIIIKGLQNASEECVNALLKSLEEPQENIFYAIHTSNENIILPTIRSRCSIIRSALPSDKPDFEDINEFMTDGVMDKASKLNTFKKRPDALAFADRLVFYFSNKLLSNKMGSDILNQSKASVRLKKSLERNGNVNLHFLKFLADIH